MIHKNIIDMDMIGGKLFVWNMNDYEYDWWKSDLW